VDALVGQFLLPERARTNVARLPQEFLQTAKHRAANISHLAKHPEMNRFSRLIGNSQQPKKSYISVKTVRDRGHLETTGGNLMIPPDRFHDA